MVGSTVWTITIIVRDILVSPINSPSRCISFLSAVPIAVPRIFAVPPLSSCVERDRPL